ncbi:hypothetical protein CMESO_304 (nucleomorph) [Chroomonas mesostigmatica CCMP1168]|uniref:Vitamin K epoxide reductase domain-containing protein n=1 Tax=Chroomonas mesostigmatica CCMP1168 TaxID=1195612 RepID=J7G857_9CRYP|nr:hypothetical protein CMESO_304 [Chroomonas mesostigmatica CCMP1168]|mmetsp:Transcript_59577/g.146336  ORF Transcript_59577/g.146336 Transcript_59577/m.146336 type:complete len:244 (+) Transcript_59577:571-1302(+)
MLIFPQLYFKFFPKNKGPIFLNSTKVSFFFSERNFSNFKKKKEQELNFKKKIFKKRKFFIGRTKRELRICEIPLKSTISFVAGIGFLETFHLSYKKIKNSNIMCGVEGCSSVLNSSFSDFMGFPVSLIGFIIYGIIFVIYIKRLFLEKKFYFDFRKENFFFFNVVLLVYGISGVYFSVILENILKINCPWCLLSILFTGTIILCMSFEQNNEKINLNIRYIISGTFLILTMYVIDLIEIFLSL